MVEVTIIRVGPILPPRYQDKYKWVVNCKIINFQDKNVLKCCSDFDSLSKNVHEAKRWNIFYFFINKVVWNEHTKIVDLFFDSVTFSFNQFRETQAELNRHKNWVVKSIILILYTHLHWFTNWQTLIAFVRRHFRLFNNYLVS